MIEPLESRNVGRSRLISIEPCHRTYYIDRCGNPEMLQVRFGQADIPGATDAKGAHSLRNRGFDAFSKGILTGKGWRLLPTTGCLQRFMLGLWSNRDGAPFVLLC